LQPEAKPEGAPADGQTRTFAPPPAGSARDAIPFAVSAGLHGLLLLALAYLLPQPILVQPPPVESISVELLTEEEVAALTPTKPEAPAEPPLPAIVPPLPLPPKEPPLVLAHAGRLYSDTALNRSARRDLGTLSVDARFEQLCDVEAMEQIAHGREEFHPERAVAYAAEDAKVTGNVMIAEGAAFLSKGHWYRLSFRCETTPDHSKVVSFDFATGGIVIEGRGLGDGAAD
jgi:Domain of Unknown Function (DUF930)